MINAVIYDEIEKERRHLLKELKKQAAYKTEEYWKLSAFKKLTEVNSYVEQSGLIDIACMDICPNGSMPVLELLRKQHKEMFLMVIADLSVSPMAYMRPNIMPTSLLLRPITEEMMSEVVEELVDAYVTKIESGDPNSMFVIETKDGKTHIPYNEIFYFESKEKRVFVQTRSEEYGFYKTIETLENELPSYFIRCHRSFIVNSRKILKVMLSQNIILLQENRDVPLSRSYKSILKGLGKGNQ